MENWINISLKTKRKSLERKFKLSLLNKNIDVNFKIDNTFNMPHMNSKLIIDGSTYAVIEKNYELVSGKYITNIIIEDIDEDKSVEGQELDDFGSLLF